MASEFEGRPPHRTACVQNEPVRYCVQQPQPGFEEPNHRACLFAVFGRKFWVEISPVVRAVVAQVLAVSIELGARSRAVADDALQDGVEIIAQNQAQKVVLHVGAESRDDHRDPIEDRVLASAAFVAAPQHTLEDVRTVLPFDGCNEQRMASLVRAGSTGGTDRSEGLEVFLTHARSAPGDDLDRAGRHDLADRRRNGGHANCCEKSCPLRAQPASSSSSQWTTRMVTIPGPPGNAARQHTRCRVVRHNGCRCTFDHHGHRTRPDERERRGRVGCRRGTRCWRMDWSVAMRCVLEHHVHSDSCLSRHRALRFS